MKVTKATLNAALRDSADQVHSARVRDVDLFGTVYAIWRPGRLTRDLLEASNLTLSGDPETWTFKSGTLRRRDADAPNLERLVAQTLNEEPQPVVPKGLREATPRTLFGQPVFVDTWPGAEMAVLDVDTLKKPMVVNRLYWEVTRAESGAERWVTASYQGDAEEPSWRTLGGLDGSGALVALLAPLRIKGSE